MKLKFLAALALSAATLCSCDDETTGIGQFVSDDDFIQSKADAYAVTTESHFLDSVYSRSNTAYLGKFTDEDYGTFTSDFLVQINCPENFQLPDRLQSIDEATLGLYYTSYFGDSLATLRLQVDTLTATIHDDGQDKNLYYTNLDPTRYYNSQNPPLATKDYSAYDRSVSDSLHQTSDYYPHVSIELGKAFCDNFKSKYDYTTTENGNTVHPYFKDAQAFVDNVLKGFYVHVINGEGSILYLSDIYLHLTVTYMGRNSADTADSLLTAVVPMTATKEVFMSTRFQNSGLQELVKDPTRTYLKTPAGICTKVTLPIEQMYEDHRTDTLNSISVSFEKLRDQSNSPYKMGTPNTLLLVRANEMKGFFENNLTNNDRTSFLSTYNSTTHSYSFSKLNRLIAHIFSEIRPEIEKGEAEWERWKAENPDWDKVLLIPVTTETDTQGNVIEIGNDLSVNSAMLVGGENLNESADESQKIQMNVIYTQPKQE
ncbi:DUF4270 domain-containing protein [uncultured Phocaeicola sp.]|uniref:DUF4270 domain-containing protein n=1 Tax=uncultured Phocaeicola sp. TaxID=990718 RepID=UPI0025FD25ED|nr:DUF4270 domain-containing protein [uncultured Phocaeicola sp.]